MKIKVFQLFKLRHNFILLIIHKINHPSTLRKLKKNFIACAITKKIPENDEKILLQLFIP